MRRELIIGILLIITGIGLFVYYDNNVRPEKEAREYLVEGQIAFERGTKESLNNSINILSKVIARYPSTSSSDEAYYYIGQSYEKLGLNRLAYLKYAYILKTGKDVSPELKNEINTRIARLTIMKRYTEEGINQLLGMLNLSNDRDYRSRIYTELGHAYLKMGQYRKSKRMFDIALNENGTNEEAILGKARSLKRIGYDNKAYDLYEYFLKYYGNFSHFTKDTRNAYLRQVYRSGYNSYRKGRYYPAISFFKRLLNYFPGSRKSEDALYWIGESYYSLQKYEAANSYFNRVLSNSYHHRNQQSRMKKGYSYFMAKRFDLAAREFQIYMNDYPHGKYFKTAKKWNAMSTKEIMYRIKDEGRTGDDEEGDLNEEGEGDIKDSQMDEGDDLGRNEGTSRGVKSEIEKKVDGQAELENVAEL
jgi:TolA-binding protein